MEQDPTREIPEITRMLAAWRRGDPEALEQLTPHIYAELRRAARAYLASEKAGHVLQPTALVHEALLRLMEWQPDAWQNRAQFFAVSSSMMRRILVQFAREQGAQKRGGEHLRVSLSEAMEMASPESDHDLVAVDEALTRLAKLDERQARVVEMRFFGGLSLEEAAEMLQVSVSTVRRDFRIARAWLHQELSPAL